MWLSDNYRIAMSFAVKAHDGQYNKYNGEPYILHPLRIFTSFLDEGYSNEYLCVALLHDVVEDTDVTMEELRHTFNEEICNSVYLLTKTPGMSNRDYYERLAGSMDDVAIRVKMADITDNLMRLDNIKDEETLSRLEKKYGLGLAILNSYFQKIKV